MHSVFNRLLDRDRGSLRENWRPWGSWGLLLFLHINSKLSAAQPQGHSMQNGGPGAAVVEPCCVNCLWSVKCSTCGRTQKFSAHLIIGIRLQLWVKCYSSIQINWCAFINSTFIQILACQWELLVPKCSWHVREIGKFYLVTGEVHLSDTRSLKRVLNNPLKCFVLCFFNVAMRSPIACFQDEKV